MAWVRCSIAPSNRPRRCLTQCVSDSRSMIRCSWVAVMGAPYRAARPGRGLVRDLWKTRSRPNKCRTSEVYVGHRFIDVLVHGWDLAVGSGQDATLDPVLVEACRQVLEPQVGGFRAAGVFGPEIAVPPDASAQTRFLAMVGRNG